MKVKINPEDKVKSKFPNAEVEQRGGVFRIKSRGASGYLYLSGETDSILGAWSSASKWV